MMGMRTSDELAAKITHTADCRCADCRVKQYWNEPTPFTSEKMFMAEVRMLLNRQGWRAYHTNNSRKSDAGFPDLVAVREKRVVGIELKTEKGVASAAQLNWIDDLKKADQEIYLWRPADWPEIVKVLT